MQSSELENDLVRQTARGCWIVSEPGEPVPTGQTRAAGVAVYQYRRGRWSCERDGSPKGTTSAPCRHIAAVRRAREA